VKRLDSLTLYPSFNGIADSRYEFGWGGVLVIPPAHEWRASWDVPSGLTPSPASPEGRQAVARDLSAGADDGLVVGKKAIHTMIQQRRFNIPV
jgi:hypothetical protein